MGTARALAAAATVCGKWYVVGGQGAEGELLQSVECFDAATGAWAACPPMQVARSGACAAALGGRLYVCGGLGHEGGLRSVEIFDPETGRWEQGPTLRGPRFSAACCVLPTRLQPNPNPHLVAVRALLGEPYP